MSTPQIATKKIRPEFRNIHIFDLTNYRLPAAGVVSILHRISGALLFLALPVLLYWFRESLLSEDSFDRLSALLSPWWVKVVLLSLAWAYLHHLVAGIRFLLLDLHIGLDKEPARATAFAVFGISLPLAALAALKIFGVF